MSKKQLLKVMYKINEKGFIHEGYFWKWGICCDEFNFHCNSYTVALIEIEDGTIIEVLPKDIKFIRNELPFKN